MSIPVLVCGFATRHVAQSAHRAGYTVYAVDHFCDQDLSWYTDDCEKFEDLKDLPGAIQEICTRHRVEWIVPVSGAELLPEKIPVLGTSPERAARFMDKLLTQKFFESLTVPVPRILPPGGYPAMVKPRTGSGGWRNRVIVSGDEMDRWLTEFDSPPFIAQEVVPGTPASVCCIADGQGHARAIAANRQILRENDEVRFGFSGSLTPLVHPDVPMMVDIAERVARASGCRGTIGIDFVLGARPWAIEVNPRFQATLDTVEAACGVNLFSLHARACGGDIPPSIPTPSRYAVRAILFAERDMVVNADLSSLVPAVADVPWKGTFFEDGQAVISVYGWGEDEGEAMAMLDTHMKRVRQYMG